MASTDTNTLRIDQLMTESGVQFGTSGARGLVVAMTDRVCYAYTLAFLQHLKASQQLGRQAKIAIAGDYRSSTPRILTAVAAAISDFGLTPEFCGYIPSPAVASYGMAEGVPSMMVTGSHIPDDRNGIKFNTATGEILKGDEAGIKTQSVSLPSLRFDDKGILSVAKPFALPPYSAHAYQQYIERYVRFFPAKFLAGKNIGLYQHSSVGREVFADILLALGASVTKLGYSDKFISVDTEAIRPEDVQLARQWAQSNRFDAIISADGDADRPLVSDEHGEWLRGDIAGILCARYLKADVVATPVSSNTAVEKCGFFRQISRTRIGSPFVVAAMQTALPDARGPVVGYEANGGFLTASDVVVGGRRLPALPTRDSILVPLAVLALAQEKNQSVAQLAATLPPRYTASNRVEHFPTALSAAKLKVLNSGDVARDKTAIEGIFAKDFGAVSNINTIDGVRITFANGEIVHLRPSGNAPEFRCYNEADTAARANAMNERCMAIIAEWKRAH